MHFRWGFALCVTSACLPLRLPPKAHWPSWDASCPIPLRESIQTVEDVVAVEPGPWVVSTSADSVIRAASAIRASRRVRFSYRSHTDVSSCREIKPYAVLHTDGRWYLIGYCLSCKALRTFRLGRVTDLEVRASTFQRPAKLDPRSYLKQSMPFIQSDYEIDVWIDMPNEEAERAFMPWRVATEKDQEGTRLRCGRDRLHPFAAMLLSMGRRIVIHKPAELRETFRELARQAQLAAQWPPRQAKTAASD